MFCRTQPQLPSVRPIAARVRQLSEDFRSSAEKHTQQPEPGVQAAEVPQLLADRHLQRASDSGRAFVGEHVGCHVLLRPVQRTERQPQPKCAQERTERGPPLPQVRQAHEEPRSNRPGV